MPHSRCPVLSAVLVIVAALSSGRLSVLSEPVPRSHLDPVLDGGMVEQFNAFVRTSGKVYADEQDFTQRMKIFAQNVRFIDDFNLNSTATGLRLAVNQFADLTRAEFKQMYLSSLPPKPPQGVITDKPLRLVDAHSVPASMDWRAKGAVTAVKDQKTCGSCWAYSATGAIEGAWFLFNGSLITLSEQELVECSHGKNQGCRGGDPAAAFEWIVENGICSNKSYPWAAYKDECHNQFQPCQVVSHISGYTNVRPYDEIALQEAVAQQPVSVEIEADTDVFRFYKSGVFKDAGCGVTPDHAVLAVGYGTENNQDYWLVKNSWNASWGEHGYIRLARMSSRASYGQCGIAMSARFPYIQRDSVVV